MTTDDDDDDDDDDDVMMMADVNDDEDAGVPDTRTVDGERVVYVGLCHGLVGPLQPLLHVPPLPRQKDALALTTQSHQHKRAQAQKRRVTGAAA
jgi:hypothetical protein